MTARTPSGADGRGPVVAAASRVVALLRLAVTWEVMVWRSLARWVARRPAGATAGVQAFGYARSVTPLFWVFIMVSAIEVPVAHVLLPWHWAQMLSLALGVCLPFSIFEIFDACHDSDSASCLPVRPADSRNSRSRPPSAMRAS